MNKELLNLLEGIENKKKEMRDFINKKDLDGAEKLKPELENLQKEYDLMKIALDDTHSKISNKKEPVKPNKSESAEFLNAVRGKSFDNQLVKGVDEDGGYTVPRDIQTQINEYREARDQLTPLIRTEPVTTFEGARTFKKRSQQTGFVTVAELERFPEKATPQFERLDYKVEKYAGFFVTSSEVLADSDQNLTGVLVDWIGNESRITRNKLILSVLNQKAKTPISHPDDILRAMQVTLDPAFHNTTTLVTNQTGLNWLSTLRYEDGRAMLQEVMAFTIPRQFAGRPLVVLSNNDFPDVGGQTPLIIGDLHEACVLFDRLTLQIRHTDVGGDAFLTDSHKWRAIERLDCQMWDDQAFVYGQIDLTQNVPDTIKVKAKK